MANRIESINKCMFGIFSGGVSSGMERLSHPSNGQPVCRHSWMQTGMQTYYKAPAEFVLPVSSSSNQKHCARHVDRCHLQVAHCGDPNPFTHTEHHNHLPSHRRHLHACEICLWTTWEHMDGRSALGRRRCWHRRNYTLIMGSKRRRRVGHHD